MYAVITTVHDKKNGDKTFVNKDIFLDSLEKAERKKRTEAAHLSYFRKKGEIDGYSIGIYELVELEVEEEPAEVYEEDEELLI